MLLENTWIVMGIALVVQSYWDIRYKEIPLLVSLAAGILGLLLSICQGRSGVELLCAVIPGVCCLMIGRLTQQGIGYGDGILITVMGMYASCDQIISIVMMAITMGGLVALGGLACRRMKGKDQLPFVPFLLVAWGLYALFEEGIII